MALPLVRQEPLGVMLQPLALRLFLMVQLPLVGVDPAPPVLASVPVEQAAVLARQLLPEPPVSVLYKVVEPLPSLLPVVLAVRVVMALLLPQVQKQLLAVLAVLAEMPGLSPLQAAVAPLTPVVMPLLLGAVEMLVVLGVVAVLVSQMALPE